MRSAINASCWLSAMIDSWCDSGGGEISLSKSPAVQPVTLIKSGVEQRLAALNVVADGVYARWIEGLG